MSEVTDTIRSRLAGLKGIASRQLPNGTVLLSSAPEIAPEAWHFVLFAPLSREEVDAIANQLGTRLPEQFSQFLQVWNGLKLFGYQMNVWGKRENYSRVGDDAWQPFDIITHNRSSERPTGTPYTVVYIGSAERGDKWIFLDLSQDNFGRVGSTNRKHYEPDRYWSDFNSWLACEFSRMWERFYGDQEVVQN